MHLFDSFINLLLEFS
jgi:hypothetical protein